MDSREATGLEVTQSLGNGQSRLVSIHFDPDAGLPASMSYDARTWTYRYNARKLLEDVELPLGAGAPGWQFEYSGEPFSTDKLTRVTTPQGGVVTYEYADREFSVGGTRATFNVLDVRRTYDHDARLLGEWKFTHFANASGGNDVTEVTLPSQTKVTYESARIRIPMRWPAPGNSDFEPCTRRQATRSSGRNGNTPPFCEPLGRNSRGACRSWLEGSSPVADGSTPPRTPIAPVRSRTSTTFTTQSRLPNAAPPASSSARRD